MRGPQRGSFSAPFASPPEAFCGTHWSDLSLGFFWPHSLSEPLLPLTREGDERREIKLAGMREDPGDLLSLFSFLSPQKLETRYYTTRDSAVFPSTRFPSPC